MVFKIYPQREEDAAGATEIARILVSTEVAIQFTGTRHMHIAVWALTSLQNLATPR